MKYTTDINKFYKRRAKRLKQRGVRFDYARPSEDYDWITINGVHTPIDENGNISGGAEGKFNGKKYTGSKIQRSKKRQEKVGGGTFKLDKSKIKSKHLSAAIKKYAKEHGGEMPDQETVHGLAYGSYKSTLEEAEKIQIAYGKKYGMTPSGEFNTAEDAEDIQRRIEQAKAYLGDTDPDDPIAEKFKEHIESLEKLLKEDLDDPNYEKHKADLDKLRWAAEQIDNARADVREFMINKGKNFQDYKEAEVWLEASGWIDFDDKKEPPYNLKSYGKVGSVHLSGMDIKFAGTIAETVGIFQKQFPKFSNILSGISLETMDEGDIGGYTVGAKSIDFATNFVGKDGIAEGQRQYKELMEKGHFPKGTDIYSTPYHEMSHAMEMAMKDYDSSKGKGVLGGKRPADVVLKRVCDRLNLTPSWAKKQVSLYAQRVYWMDPESNNTEFLAEAMSEAYTSKSPRKVASAVREEFEKLYHEVYD